MDAGLPQVYRQCDHRMSPDARQPEIEAEQSWGSHDAVAGGCEVATDGSSIGNIGVRRAGWGLYWGAGDARYMAGTVIGWVQTAARAEAYPVPKAFTVADRPTTIITDNKGVWRKLRRLLQGQRAASPHQGD